jgi:hypothetical protein
MSRGTNHSAEGLARDTGREEKAQVGRPRTSAITTSTGLRRRWRRFESYRGHYALPACITQRHRHAQPLNHPRGMTGFKCSGEPLAAGLDLRRRVRSHLRVRWAAAGTPPAPSRARRTSPVAGPGRTSRQSRHPTSSAASCPWASTVVVAFIPTPWSPSLLFTAPDNDRPAGAKEPSGLPPDHAGQAHQPAAACS